jgi:peptidoglycan LD-endopeptidase LytH
MKRLPTVWRISILIVALAGFTASCEDKPSTNQNADFPQNQNTSTIPTPKVSPTVLPEIKVSPLPTPNVVTAVTPATDIAPEITNVAPNTNAPNSNMTVVAVEKLIIPVAGIKREELRDTFKDSRSEGRVHDAIDIMAPVGAPVLAAADGEIARFFDSVKGGITIYQFSRDKKLIYYYAHLQRRADGLQERQFVKQGTVIGYVGDTGNSGAGNYHLHFAIWTVDDPKRYWNGTNINPYPLLR